MTEKKKKIDEFDENMKISSIGDKAYRWIDPMKNSEIRISGFCWLDQEQLYRRMPVSKNGYLPPAVDSLSNCCAGGQLRFRTNSSRVAIDAKFANSHTLDMMLPTGELGFDCYIGEFGEMLYAGTSRFTADSSQYTVPLFENLSEKTRTVTVNFPLYNDTLSEKDFNRGRSL